MRVFEVNTICGTGSTGRIAAELAHMLEEKGDECCIAFSRGNAPADVTAYQFGNRWEIIWHGIMTRLTDRHGMYSKSATRELIGKIREYQPDVIHLHNLHGYYLNIELLFEFLKEYGKPVVWTLHDCWTYTGHCYHYECVHCSRWMQECHDCPLKKDYPGSLFLDRSRENYKKKKELFTSVPKLHLVTPSIWLREEVKKSFFGQPSKLYPTGVPCTAIPNGIDIEKFQKHVTDLKQKMGLEGKKIVLGVANVWTKQKGFEDFIALSKMLDESFRIVMVGVDKKRKKQLPDSIIALERTNHLDELIALYSIADVYFNSSIEETMGMTTGEAICCGTPVVVYRSTAIPESVGEGCGFVLEAGDLEGVKNAIVTISSDREPYSRACLAYKKRFDQRISNETYDRIYQEMYSAGKVL